MNLIFLRHGLSEWNIENKFTGWVDISLHQKGIEEAKKARDIILESNFIPDIVYTSYLERSIQTAKIVSDKEFKKDWRLNERHYGALQGLNKKETSKKYGEAIVHEWRRGFDTRPPLLSVDSPYNQENIEIYKDLDIVIPLGESLKDVLKRVKPLLEQIINEASSKKVLVVAHGNSIRAIIKIIENISDDKITSVNIPTCVPLAFNVDELNKEKVIQRIGYLGNEEDILSATKEVEQQSHLNKK